MHRRKKVKITSEMILGLMQGKDMHIIIRAEKEEDCAEFIFVGPFDGMFLSHDEIAQIKYNSEIISVMEKIRKNKIEEHILSVIEKE